MSGTSTGSGTPLRAAHVLEFPFTRSVGPVLSRFFSALRDDRQFLAARTRDGQVIVPPQEYDAMGRPIEDLVPVGPGGEIVSWCWVPAPRERAPLAHPFAWALIRLDGLASNPIGASGMCRYAEAAMQVRGQAGEHQVDAARVALGHAFNGGAQYFSLALFGASKP